MTSRYSLAFSSRPGHSPLLARFTFRGSRFAARGSRFAVPVSRFASERGFTFIEIMVVVAILAILAALVVPRVMGRTDDAKRTAAKVQIRNIEGALHLYKLDNSVYPSTEQGLKALVEKPTVGAIPKNWKVGGYLPKVPDDPWGTPYKYVSPSTHGDYEIISYATDGESGGEGKNADITNWDLDKE